MNTALADSDFRHGHRRAIFRLFIKDTSGVLFQTFRYGHSRGYFRHLLYMNTAGLKRRKLLWTQQGLCGLCVYIYSLSYAVINSAKVCGIPVVQYILLFILIIIMFKCFLLFQIMHYVNIQCYKSNKYVVFQQYSFNSIFLRRIAEK